MNWNYPFGTTEFVFSLLFVGAYAAFFVRTIRVARRLKTTTRSLIIKLFIRTIAFVLLLISLLGPSFGEAERDLQSQGKDIYLLVDLSKSMDANDVSPTRLEKVKFEINHFLDAMANNRIGLIVFSNEAYTQSPLTYDRAAMNLYVQSLQTDLLPGSGTNLCSSLELAYLKVSQDEAAADKSKIMVLFTDAEKKADCSASLFNNFRRFGIRLFVIGVGTPEGSFIRTQNSVLKDEDGESVISKLQEDVIKNLVQQTQGQGYRIDNKQNELSSVIHDINSIEGQVIDRRRVTVASNKYYYFLIIALGLLVLDLLITVRTFRL
ncbi:VWA domain-containing protein [Salmonirosea aquatica]|uniref:VWA domain-containing protein n=1 Tax=Salmonirosea aquatica TaxID=2654236 RepID=A0A7C9FZF5_9BACT|nr:VWA domain-containing protein [Cytophagaceae bacterium SJW1-29]